MLYSYGPVVVSLSGQSWSFCPCVASVAMVMATRANARWCWGRVRPSASCLQALRATSNFVKMFRILFVTVGLTEPFSVLLLGIWLLALKVVLYKSAPRRGAVVSVSGRVGSAVSWSVF